jgi:hypothetical protein
VTASKRDRRREKEQGQNGGTANFEIRSGTEWDIVVGKDRDAGRAPVPTPPSPPAADTGNHSGGWLNVPSAAPAAEVILANLMSRVQKLEGAVRRLEALWADRPDAPSS